MANRYFNPVNFALEQNTVVLSARVTFNTVGSQSGVPTLDTINSKGICSVNIQSIMFAGGTTNSVSSLDSVSSFEGLYTGMRVVNGGGVLQGGTTIGSLSGSTKIMTLNKQAISTLAFGSFTADGGRYVVQFGTEAAKRLDPYYKLLHVQASWDMSLASASGSTGVVALAPQAPQVFVVDNNSKQRTIPGTATSGSTDCSLSIQLGTGAGTSFVAYNPQPGEAVRLFFIFANSSGG